MERKDFMKFISASVLTGSFVAFVNACKKNDVVSTAPNADFTLDITTSANSALQHSGGSVISNSVIVINNNGTYVALSDICTHQGCNVNYNNNSKTLNCPCHNSNFSISGAVMNGPAPSPLKQYTVAQNGNILHVTG